MNLIGVKLLVTVGQHDGLFQISTGLLDMDLIMKFTCEKRKYLNQLTLYFFQVSNVTGIVGFSLNLDD